MRVSTVTLITLATLTAQSLTDEAHSAVYGRAVSGGRVPDINNLRDAIGDTPITSVASISPPEMLVSQNFSSAPATSPETRFFEKTGFLPAPQTDELLARVVEETWLAKLVEFSVENNPQARSFAEEMAAEEMALRNEISPEGNLNLNPTLTLLNTLLIVATGLPLATIAFFWLVRRLVIKELVSEVNKRLNRISDLETKLNNSRELSEALIRELESQIVVTKKSLNLINKEAKISQSSIEQIETLKSQFLMQLQTIVAEAQEAKHKAFEDIYQVEKPPRERNIDSVVSPINLMVSSPEMKRQKTAVKGHEAKRVKQIVKTNGQDSRSNNAQIIPLLTTRKHRQPTAEETIQELTVIPQENTIADDYIKQGEGLLFEGRYQEAIAACDKAIALNPSLSQAWYQRGNALFKLQRFAESIASYDKAIALNPTKYDFWYNRARSFVKLQRYEEAIASCDKAVALQPDAVEVWNYRGSVLKRLQRYEEAIASYDKALELEPENAESWHNRGVLLGRLQRYDEAIASYDKAIALGPDKYEIWYNRGNLLGRLQRYEEGVASYDKAIALVADKYEIWYNRGALLWRLGRYDEAIASYDKSLALESGDYEVWHNRGAALSALGKYSEAIASYDKAVVLQPQCYEALLGKGEGLWKLERYEEAIATYQQATQINPGRFEAWLCCGSVLEKLERLEEALICLDKALAIYPDSYEAWGQRGIVLEKLERYQEALAAYDRAIAIQPEDAESWRNRGAVLSELQRYEEAIASLSQAISIQQNLRNLSADVEDEEKVEAIAL
jgi:tetratricopeptide (TPR) repeat protein